MTEIAGRIAVVTGGGSGIGEGLAMALAREGVAVAVSDIRLEGAERVADAIRTAGGRAIAIECDVCDRASIAAMRDATAAAFGTATLVFANAGATSFDPLAEMTDDDVDWIVTVNLMGTMNTLRAFLPAMIANGGGHLIATASVAGLMPGLIPDHAPYSASKAGIIGLMLNLAHELRPHGIATTTYCPGGVASGMKVNNARYRPARFGGAPVEAEQADEIDARFLSDNPLRFYAPADVAPMVLEAVRRDRPFAFDHPEQRQAFRQTYSDVVEACFDDAEAYERTHGVPDANPAGPILNG